MKLVSVIVISDVDASVLVVASSLVVVVPSEVVAESTVDISDDDELVDFADDPSLVIVALVEVGPLAMLVDVPVLDSELDSPQSGSSTGPSDVEIRYAASWPGGGSGWQSYTPSSQLSDTRS